MSETTALARRGPAPMHPLERVRELLLDSVSSPHTRRIYGKALDEFFRWQDVAGRPGLNKAAVQAFRADMQRRGLAPSTANVYLSAIRKLAAEAADNLLLNREVAIGVARVSGVRQTGVRAGKWLTPEEASLLINALDVRTLKGARDRAILALLMGCGLRRAELASLTVSKFELRDGRWVLPDLAGKGRRIRTVPVPRWVKLAVDEWLHRAEITEGPVLRRFRKGGCVTAEALSEDAIWAIVRECGAAIGHSALAPHDLRRTCAKLCRTAGGDLEQIQMLLGHASIQTTERYLGSRQNLAHAVNDSLPVRLSI